MISAGRRRSSSARSAASPSNSVVLKSPVVRSAARQAEDLARGAERGQEIIPLRRQQPFIEMGARAEDLRDLAFDELAGTRLLQLLADGDLASGLEQAADVSAGRVKGDAAHRDLRRGWSARR